VINPVEVAPVRAGDVVIDVDGEVPVEAAKSCALDAVALEENYGIVMAADAEGEGDRVGLWQVAIDDGEAIRGDQVDVLAELAEEHSHGQHAAYGVAIGPRMRADEETLALAEDTEDGGDGGDFDGGGGRGGV
jgi:hypothetical protein